MILRIYNSCERKHIETSKCQENVWHKLYVLLNFYIKSVTTLLKIFIGHLKHLLLNRKRAMKYGKAIRKKKKQIKKKHVEMLGSNQRSCVYFVTTLDIFFQSAT